YVCEKKTGIGFIAQIKSNYISILAQFSIGIKKRRKLIMCRFLEYITSIFVCSCLGIGHTEHKTDTNCTKNVVDEKEFLNHKAHINCLKKLKIHTFEVSHESFTNKATLKKKRLNPVDCNIMGNINFPSPGQGPTTIGQPVILIY
ncbi:hypothetical protein ACJX0J_032901, partial [Zea mays]